MHVSVHSPKRQLTFGNNNQRDEITQISTNAFLIPSRIVFGSRGSVESEAITATALFIQCVFFFDLVLVVTGFLLEELAVVFLLPLAVPLPWDLLERPTLFSLSSPFVLLASRLSLEELPAPF